MERLIPVVSNVYAAFAQRDEWLPVLDANYFAVRSHVMGYLVPSATVIVRMVEVDEQMQKPTGRSVLHAVNNDGKIIVGTNDVPVRLWLRR